MSKTPEDLDGYYKECVETDPRNLDDMLKRLPADFAFWNEQYANALRRELRADMNMRTVSDSLRIVKREEIEALRGKATESMVDAEVTADRNYAKAREELIDAEVEATRLKGRLEALRIKRDMVMQIAAQTRIEMMGDPMVRAERRTDRDVRQG